MSKKIKNKMVLHQILARKKQSVQKTVWEAGMGHIDVTQQKDFCPPVWPNFIIMLTSVLITLNSITP